MPDLSRTTDKSIGSILRSSEFVQADVARDYAFSTGGDYTHGAIFSVDCTAANAGVGSETVTVQFRSRLASAPGSNSTANHQFDFWLVLESKVVNRYYTLAVGTGTALDTSMSDGRLNNSTARGPIGGNPKIKIRTDNTGLATVTIAQYDNAGAASATDPTFGDLQVRVEADVLHPAVSLARMCTLVDF